MKTSAAKSAQSRSSASSTVGKASGQVLWPQDSGNSGREEGSSDELIMDDLPSAPLPPPSPGPVKKVARSMQAAATKSAVPKTAAIHGNDKGKGKGTARSTVDASVDQPADDEDHGGSDKGGGAGGGTPTEDAHQARERMLRAAEERAKTVGPSSFLFASRSPTGCTADVYSSATLLTSGPFRPRPLPFVSWPQSRPRPRFARYVNDLRPRL